MTSDLKTSLVSSLTSAAEKAGMVLISVKQGADFHGHPTAVFELGLSGPDAIGRSLKLELSDAFDFDKPNLLPEMAAHLAGEAKRLRNPRPDCYVTLGGLPLAFGQFAGLVAKNRHVAVERRSGVHEMLRRHRLQVDHPNVWLIDDRNAIDPV